MDEPIIRGPGQGEALPMGATHGEIKAAHADTRGRFALIDTTFAPGFRGPPPHLHREMHDCVYVIDGALVFQVEGRRVEAGPGTFLAVPPGVVHTFTNESAEPARVLNLFAPAGLEGYLRELAALGRASDPATMAELASRYDFELADS
jgi:quercetin dioxygenase-like cupin family protein